MVCKKKKCFFWGDTKIHAKSLGVASWHVPLDEISCLAWLTRILPSSTTFAQIFVWGMVLFFLVTHLPVV
jgi:hypothetical protein